MMHIIWGKKSREKFVFVSSFPNILPPTICNIWNATFLFDLLHSESLV